MNVSNSNKLGLPVTSASAGGGKASSAKAGKSSSGDAFVDFLNSKAKPDAKPDAKPEQKAERDPDAGQKQAGNPNQGLAKNSAGNKNPAGNSEKKSPVEANAMPGTPGLPGLQGPAIGDRVIGTPVNSPVGALAEKTPVPTEEAGVDSLTRRVVWNDFLRKMKDELGVLPEDVLHAFSQLSDEDLNMPPQQTVDKIVMALGLNPQEAQVAKTHFVELVKKTQSPTMGDELSASHKQLNLTLMTQRELQRKALDKSLKSMDESFFMNSAAHLNAQAQLRLLMQNQAAMKEEGSEQQDPATAFYGAPAALEAGSAESADLGARLMSMDPSMPAQAAPLSEMTDAAGAAPAPGFDKMSLSEAKPAATKAFGKAAVKSEAAQPAGMDQLLAQMQAPAAEDQKAMDALLKKFNEGKLAQPAANLGSDAAVQATSAVKAAPAPAAAAAAGIGAAIGGILAGKGDKEMRDENDGETSSADLTQVTGARDQMQNTKLGAEFKTEMAQQGAGPTAASIPELIQNAEVMVKDGGGEMKIVLRPDGLGEVTMKVNVHEGKVSVQMVTESDEAKKMIEREMGSLKASLATNNLRLDTIKVDTASSLGAQLDQQYQDSQRQQAQQAMESFRQNQQGWRKSFFEVPSAKSYRGQSEAPRDVKAPSRAQAKGNKRLDLVA